VRTTSAGHAAAAPGRSTRSASALDTIDGAPEASETTLFDRSFRPACKARERWQRVWLAPSGGWPGMTPVGPLESPAQD
jgi:hypothetical protein